MDCEGIPDRAATGKDSLPVQTASEPTEQATGHAQAKASPQKGEGMTSGREQEMQTQRISAASFDAAIDGKWKELGYGE